ncbi:MAG: ABC transporter permease subunit [Planctomycetes bacterium]|nr:ABC transporter permease subunit [Planctomycetota bacterium]
MSETIVIFRRELKSYFLSPIAYVFGALLLALLLFFATSNMLVQGASADMQAFFTILPFVFVLFLPGLTMRLWAEEQKLGTIQLLMTFPVRVSHLVIGKFGAAVLFLGFVLVMSVGLPLTLGAYGRLDWPPVIGAYCASLLFASSFVAVGMFWSSATQDQIVAMLLSLCSLLALFFVGNPVLVDAITGWMPAWMVDVVTGVSPYMYFQSITRGVIDTRDIVYFACFCGFFLYANAMMLNRRRQNG